MTQTTTKLISPSAFRGRLFLTLLMMLLTTATAGAQTTETLGGYTFTIETDDEGSYYVIDCKEALDALASYVKSNNSHHCSGKRFKQTADIAYTHTSAWDDTSSDENNYTPIGGYFSGDRFFRGTYDGQGHTISGIRRYKGSYGQSDENQGIFGMTGDGAVIRGITLADARITGYSSTGGIVGYIYGSTTVSDCHVAANVTICAYRDDAEEFGGIVGLNNGGTVNYCTSAATIIKSKKSTCHAGIVGGNAGTMSHNLAIGAVVPATPNNTHGAICGLNRGTLKNNYYYGCKVASDDVTSTGVGCGYIYDGNGGYTTADVTENDGAVPGIILYDNSSRTGINSYILTTVGNAAVSRVELAGRTLYKDGDWNTLCLPFDLTIAGSTLDGADVRALDNANLTDGVLTLNFTNEGDVTEIEAGKPYIIKWASGENLVNPVFSGVTVSNSAEALARQTVESADGKVQFIGSYSPVTLTGGDKSVLYLGAENNLYWPSADRTLGACRAYFHLTDGQEAHSIRLSFDSTTGVESVQGSRFKVQDAGATGWVDLLGRKLSGRPTQKGMYIHDGKTVAVE